MLLRSRSAQSATRRYRLLVVALLALWLAGQHASAEHARHHLQHEADCAVYLAAGSPAIHAALPPAPRVGRTAIVALPAVTAQLRSHLAAIRNRGPPSAPTPL